MAGGRKFPRNKKHRAQFSAAASVANNVDLLTEILLRLSSRTLIRSQCVSKQWLSLISDPQFRHNHTQNRQYSQVSGLYFNTWNSDQQHTVSLTGSATRVPALGFLGSKIRIITQCKGLLLCCNDDSYVLCNPTTKNYKLIPFPEKIDTDRAGYDTSLAWDPSISSVFKLVFQEQAQTWIYSSDTCSWKHIPVNFRMHSHGVFFSGSHGVFFSGSLYYVAHSHQWMMRYDVEAEKFRDATKKPFVGEKVYFRETEKFRDATTKVPFVGEELYFGETSGRLVLVLSRITNRDYWLNIYESCDCSRWTKYRVKLTPTLEYSSVREAPLLCVVSNRASGRYYELVLAVGGQIVSYSQRRDKEKLKVLSHSPSYNQDIDDVSSVCPFFETLAPV